MTDSRIPDVYQHPDGRIAIDRRPGNYGVLVTDASGWVTPEVHLSVPAGFVRLVPETEAGAFVGDDPALAAYRAEARECPACWLDIPNQTPVPYHADSTGITTCPASGQALTREKENA